MDSPSLDSISLLVLLATFPPSLAIFLFYANPTGLCFSASFLVVNSPISASATSNSDILSLNDSFLNPLYYLYSFAFIPNHSL